MRIPGADRAIENLLKWSAKEEWSPLHEQLFAEHFDLVCDRFDTTVEDIADLLGEGFGLLLVCILEDFFTCRFGDEGDSNIIDDYLKRRGWREKVPAKRYLEALRDSALSLHEVVDLDPGHSMTVRDMVLGGDPVTVEEKLGSKSAARWDRIAGRIVWVNKKPYFTGGTLLFRHETADEVLSGIDEMIKTFKKNLRKAAKEQGEPADFKDRDLREFFLHTSARLFTRTWLIDVLSRATGPLPEIRNSDGDEIIFSEARFSITGEVAEVAAGLDQIDEFDRDDPDKRQWTWRGLGSPSQRVSHRKNPSFEIGDDAGRTLLGNIEISEDAVVLTTNSAERADKGRNLVLSRLDGLVGPPLITHQGLEKMLDEGPGFDSAESELPAEVTGEAIHAFLDGHYRQSLDQQLPYLGGETPRQAARTKNGREQVTNWLKMLENTDARRAASQGHRPYDFGWMWRELKIDDPS